MVDRTDFSTSAMIGLLFSLPLLYWMRRTGERSINVYTVIASIFALAGAISFVVAEETGMESWVGRALLPVAFGCLFYGAFAWYSGSVFVQSHMAFLALLLFAMGVTFQHAYFDFE